MSDVKQMGREVRGMQRLPTIPEEQQKYYRVNLATSWLCNRCRPQERDRMLGEILRLRDESVGLETDVLELYAQMLEGRRANWITQNYWGLFVEAMEILLGTRKDTHMHPTEREHAHRVALDIYRGLLEELYRS